MARQVADCPRRPVAESRMGFSATGKGQAWQCLKRDRPTFCETPRLVARGNSSVRGHQLFAAEGDLLISPLGKEGGVDMLGLVALVLIVLWLLGFLAFHVSAGLIHILLVVGLVLLILHFVRGGTRTA